MVATGSMWLLSIEVWLIQIEMCCKFQTLGMKKNVKYVIKIILNIDYILK